MKKLKKDLDKAEDMMTKAQSNISALARHIQPFFDFEIWVVSSSDDGAMIVSDKGEIMTVRSFLDSENVKQETKLASRS